MNIWDNKQTYYIDVLHSEWYKNVAKLENLITTETIKFYESKKFLTLHFPITTGSISSPMGRGSDSKPVKVNIDGIDVYLADSMQFLLEYGCRLTNENCYYIMPSFRGEKADATHLCQFYHSEAEIIGTLEDVMVLVQEYIQYLARKILDNLRKELKLLIGDISHIEKLANMTTRIPKLTFDEAEKILSKEYPKNINEFINYEENFRTLTRKGEQELISIYGGFVWVSNFDYISVPFYQKKDTNDRAKNADLLFGYGEVVGCGERHYKYNELEESLKLHEVNTDEYNWYINIKKLFPMQTSGFGMGAERFLMWVLKCADIRNLQICLRFNGEKSEV